MYINQEHTQTIHNILTCIGTPLTKYNPNKYSHLEHIFTKYYHFDILSMLIPDQEHLYMLKIKGKILKTMVNL